MDKPSVEPQSIKNLKLKAVKGTDFGVIIHLGKIISEDEQINETIGTKVVLNADGNITYTRGTLLSVS